MKTIIVRFVFALMLVHSALGISASAVLADAPVKHESTITVPAVANVCSFLVNVVSTYAIEETDYFDQSGILTRIYQHVNAQDTFTAGSKTLVGNPYTFNVELLFDSSGTLIHFYLQGVYEKIPLPDGSLFITAGRTDVIHHPGTSFGLYPDKGNQGNIAAFCAALAP